MNTWRVLVGDARERLGDLPERSVQTCITSPPYWGLRDYGTASWEGGDLECDHKQGRDGAGRADGIVDDRAQRNRDGIAALTRTTCRCGAVRVDAQIGLEPTPDGYVASLVDVFREVRRVLRDDGTLWLNLGDSYANDTKWGGSSSGKHVSELHGNTGIGRQKVTTGLKAKDLVGIPWRVAFALQADGWYLRSDIVWAKPNPMPESVTDRPTKAHEYLFLLAKSAEYFYDAMAIAEDAVTKMKPRDKNAEGWVVDATGSNCQPGERIWAENGKRNKRSVWTVALAPYPDAHFATYPPALIEPCVLAGSRVGDAVLDPFCGSGTTGEVALLNGRDFVGIELNPEYVTLARKRIGSAAPLFAREYAE